MLLALVRGGGCPALLAQMEGNETFADKARRKFKAEPLVPIGTLVTAGVLVGGILSFRRGNKVASQNFMRARVLAQGATCVALGYGAYVFDKNKQPFSDAGYTGNLAPAEAKAK